MSGMYAMLVASIHRRYQDEVVRDIEDRMAHWTHLPADHGEDLQVRQPFKSHKIVKPRLGYGDVQDSGEDDLPRNPLISGSDGWLRCAGAQVPAWSEVYGTLVRI